MISARTKEALARTKAKGARLGNPRLDEVRRKGAESMKATADRFAAHVLPMIEPVRVRVGAFARSRVAIAPWNATARSSERREHLEVPEGPAIHTCRVFIGPSLFFIVRNQESLAQSNAWGDILYWLSREALPRGVRGLFGDFLDRLRLSLLLFPEFVLEGDLVSRPNQFKHFSRSDTGPVGTSCR